VTAAAAVAAPKKALPERIPPPAEDTYKKAAQADSGNQVGGHGGKKSLKFRDGKVLKPVDPTTHELAFYEAVATGGAPLVVTHALVPAYSGRETVQDPEFGAVEYIVLEDVTAGFRNPSILDIKMGNQTWDQDCSEEKRTGHVARDAETTTGRMGFRFCGMRVWNAAEGKAAKYPKHFGWDATKEDQMLQCLVTFVHDGTRVRFDVLGAFLARLALIEEFIEQGTWRFYAASILLVYDVEGGHPPEVRMIDFAHAWPITDGSRDNGFLMGLGYLKSYWKKILAHAPPQPKL
jgi:hypothetical protein